MEKQVSIQVNARHIGQLGRELVTDYVTALTELVKNSYDADGEAVEISFNSIVEGDGTIIVADTGRGFTEEDIIKKWAVIGTNSKIKEPYSPIYKRRCAGRKGIGRYSVERLAEHCTLVSFPEGAPPIKYYTNWNQYEGIDLNELKQRVEILKNSVDFDSAKYIKRTIEYILSNKKIDDSSKKIIENQILRGRFLNHNLFYNINDLILIQSFLYPICEKYSELEEKIGDIKNTISYLESKEKEYYYQKLVKLYEKVRKDEIKAQGAITGTFLVLDCLRDNWMQEDIQKVTKELRLLVSPLKEEKNNFAIYINAPDYEIHEMKLENNILKQRFAKVVAYLNVSGNGERDYSVLNATYEDKECEAIQLHFDLGEILLCGNINVTLYYFLRDAASLKFENLKSSEAKAVLDAFCGVKIYRDGFRVRPYGEEGNDWLLLDYQKIRDTHSYRVGNNQIIGVVTINSDDNPLLIDSTNREAIIENKAFEQLRMVVKKCIQIIENHRYDQYIKDKANSNIEKEEQKRKREKENFSKEIIEKRKQVEEAVKSRDIEVVNDIVNVLLETVSTDQRKEELHYEKTKQEYEKRLQDSDNELKLYKNLAALGIVAGSFGHETDDAIARILLNIEYPRERILSYFPNDVDIINSFNDLDSDMTRISCYSDFLIAFLKKRKRSQIKNLSFKMIIEDIVHYYKVLVNEYNIKIDISDLEEFSCAIPMKQIDVESVIVNLLTNAFEALKGVDGSRVIKISTYVIKNGYQIIVEDSGPGISESNRDWIFIPLNTTKEEDGVGLGLTIVRDVVSEYNGTIGVKNSKDLGGAKFEIFYPDEEVNNE